jgi:hypothetical protein
VFAKMPKYTIFVLIILLGQTAILFCLSKSL